MRDWAKLHVDISKSRSFASLVNEEPRAGLLFLMMLPRADVLGIVDAHPVIFRGEVCPLLAISEEEIERFLALIQDRKMILLYQDDRESRWAWVRSWGKYQDVRWTHVGVPTRPLPEGWKAPEALQKHLRDKPDSPVAVGVKDLQSSYITPPVAPTVPTTELDGAPCERAQDGDSYTSDVEGDSEGEGEDTSRAGAHDPRSPHPDPFRDLWNAITAQLQPGAGANRNIRPLPKDCAQDEAIEIRERWLAVEAKAGRGNVLLWAVEAQSTMTGRVFTGMGHLSYCEGQVQLDGARTGSEEMTAAAEESQKASDEVAEMWRKERMKNVVEILPDEEQDHGRGPPL